MWVCVFFVFILFPLCMRVCVHAQAGHLSVTPLLWDRPQRCPGVTNMGTKTQLTSFRPGTQVAGTVLWLMPSLQQRWLRYRSKLDFGHLHRMCGLPFESEARVVSREVRFIMLTLLVHTLSQLGNHEGGKKVVIRQIHKLYIWKYSEIKHARTCCEFN